MVRSNSWGQRKQHEAARHDRRLAGRIADPHDGAGHWIQQERPAEINAALIAFLKQVS